MTLGISVLLQNAGGPLITRELALKVARLLIEAKYPAGMFQIAGDGDVEDEDAFWRVSFRNALAESAAGPVIERLGVRLRKSNCEIDDFF